MKTFNTTGRCISDKHYMVCIDDKLAEIQKMVDKGDYFIINRARQYGKTTTLRILAEFLKEDYTIISLDFQKMSNAKFEDEHIFAAAFTEYLIKTIKNKKKPVYDLCSSVLEELSNNSKNNKSFALVELFTHLSELCDTAKKPVVLIIDEVDSATNNQVFLDFLAQLRGYYLDREETPIFHSVILAGVYDMIVLYHDIKNLKRKIRPDGEHKYNSPWNIAETFDVDMSFSAKGIAGMLTEYENDYHTGMDVFELAQSIYDYTSGYPFLVSLICKTIDMNVSEKCNRLKGTAAWSVGGVNEAVKIILKEPATLFDSLIKQINSYKELRDMIHAILFQGDELTFNTDNEVINLGAMFGYIKDKNGNVAVANRIFETRLYNLFLSEEELTNATYREAQKDKNQFIKNGILDMDLVMQKFVAHFHDVYGDNDKKFVEKYGRKFFLLYLKPIINGVGNYYVEAETRDLKRTDVIVDYLGMQFIIELKIWNGEKYNMEGESQLADYLERYHLNKGYLLSFSFNKNKEIGVKTVKYGDKTILEAIV